MSFSSRMLINYNITHSLWFQLQLWTKVELHLEFKMIYSYVTYCLPTKHWIFISAITFLISKSLFYCIVFFISHSCFVATIYYFSEGIWWCGFFSLFSACVFPLDFSSPLLTGSSFLFEGFRKVVILGSF